MNNFCLQKIKFLNYQKHFLVNAKDENHLMQDLVNMVDEVKHNFRANIFSYLIFAEWFCIIRKKHVSSVKSRDVFLEDFLAHVVDSC